MGYVEDRLLKYALKLKLLRLIHQSNLILYVKIFLLMSKSYEWFKMKTNTIFFIEKFVFQILWLIKKLMDHPCVNSIFVYMPRFDVHLINVEKKIWQFLRISLWKSQVSNILTLFERYDFSLWNLLYYITFIMWIMFVQIYYCLMKKLFTNHLTS